MINIAGKNLDFGENKKVFKKLFKEFCEVTKNPYEFLSVQNEKSEEIKNIINELYIWSIHKDETNTNLEILPEIILEGMDEEQIWQQIELRNNCIWPHFLAEASKQISLNDDRFKITLKTDDSENKKEEANSSEIFDDESVGDTSEGEDFFQDSESMTDEDFASDKTKRKKVPTTKTKQSNSIVDDKFFNLGEMEEFLNAEDEKERKRYDGKLKTDDEGIDYFNQDLSDEEEENVNYKKFFDDEDEEEIQSLNKENGNQFDEEPGQEDLRDKVIIQENTEENIEEDSRENALKDSEDQHEEAHSSENKEQNKSSFELRQARLRNRIEEYEEEALNEKPWQLKGEIVSTGRPHNSLLQEILEFESTTRPAPIITEETTQRLEDLIKQRIRDKAWDDVERTVKAIQTPKEFRKQLVLNQEKSKESLAQIYEKEYQKEIAKLDPNKEENEEEPKQHKEIKELMKSLFNKLDALSNFHYTPKPVAPEPKIITNIPAVNMEEVAPISVSTAKLLAPEEIKVHARGEIIGKSERTRTDKNRERRKKKARQKAIHIAKEERDLEKQKLGIKLSKKEEKNKMLKAVLKSKNVQKVNNSTDEGALKSSKAFFSHLQDKTTMKPGKERKNPFSDSISAKKLKL